MATREIRLHQFLNVRASYTALYNPAYSKATPRVGMLVARVLTVLLPHLDLPADTKVLIKPLRQPCQAMAVGFVGGEDVHVEFDPRDRRSGSSLFGTLSWDNWVYQAVAHELIHIKQRIEGRLEYRYGPKLNTEVWWNGERWENPSDYESCASFEDYRNLPWEREAYDAQQDLAELVESSLIIK